MRFHLPCLPHTLPTPEYVHCAYTEKVRKFAVMMRSLGHEVLLYTSDEPYRPDSYLQLAFEQDAPIWRRQNLRAIAGIAANLQPRDFLCLIGGLCQKMIADAFPTHQSVEFGIGYYGVFAKYQVFESYWHMSQVYAKQGVHQGRFFDAVIPNYFDPDDFPFSADKDPYLLFVGRLNDDKGIHVAADIARRSAMPLVVAGQGTPPPGVDYRGLIQAKERGALMSRATALLAPTLYLEPFGGVAVEAQLCGTPVITTDFGAFPETVEQGVTGFRCHYLGEFLEAVRLAPTLEPSFIRDLATSRFSMDAIRYQYQRYFERLLLLWGDGWHDLRPPSTHGHEPVYSDYSVNAIA